MKTEEIQVLQSIISDIQFAMESKHERDSYMLIAYGKLLALTSICKASET